MDIYSVGRTKRELAETPRDEHIILLLLGAISNDVQQLNKQLIMAMPTAERKEHEIAAWGRHAAAMLNLRMLAGRLHEAVSIIQDADRFGRVRDLYKGLLSQAARDALSRIDEYETAGAARSLLAMVRDKIAFHCDFGMARAAFNELDDDEMLVEYISKANGNTLFFSSEIIHMQAIRRHCGRDADVVEAMAVLQHVAVEMTKDISTLVAGYHQAFIHRHFADRVAGIRESGESIGDPPLLDELQIPYFVEIR